MFSFLYSRGGQARLSEAAAVAADMGFERAAWRHRLEGPQQQQQHDKDSMTTTTLQLSVYTCYMYMMNLYVTADEQRFDGSSSTTCLHDPSTLSSSIRTFYTTCGVCVCRGTASLRAARSEAAAAVHQLARDINQAARLLSPPASCITSHRMGCHAASRLRRAERSGSLLSALGSSSSSSSSRYIYESSDASVRLFKD
uniref:Uncharacterized protein n=1 Tax=Trichogramma kaykai TaxID=54128 RepID=A0ABD2X7F4_9HYME